MISNTADIKRSVIGKEESIQAAISPMGGGVTRKYPRAPAIWGRDLGVRRSPHALPHGPIAMPLLWLPGLSSLPARSRGLQDPSAGFAGAQDGRIPSPGALL
ncbi:hypothetical protein NDU88_007313 [Pleurodeles waltl]|uniref:Uncharacterized protein n=1 Tax=Pleurodeles waltl TaxID=8319 RepID=A0AAV7VT66_PLEWA|nr:hypothetical protein NDU88_007313 [Pleurodeles waltl]